MAYKKVYDFKKVSVNIGTGEDAFPVEALVSVSATRAEDTNSTYVAADGSYRNVRNNNESGTITITLAAHSSTHDKLNLLFISGVQFPIAIVDKTSTAAVAFGDGCMIVRPPDWERGLEESEAEWNFTCGNLQLVHSGAADA